MKQAPLELVTFLEVANSSHLVFITIDLPTSEKLANRGCVQTLYLESP